MYALGWHPSQSGRNTEIEENIRVHHSSIDKMVTALLVVLLPASRNYTGIGFSHLLTTSTSQNSWSVYRDWVLL